MQIQKQPQISGKAQPTLTASGEKLAVTAGNETRLYDFSALEIGQFLEGPDDIVLAAWRGEDGLHVDVLWPISPDAAEEDKFPEPLELEDATELPEGEEIPLTFLWPEEPEPAPETQAIVEVMQSMLAADITIPDTAVLAMAKVYSYPGYEVGATYKKGQIVQKDGVFYEAITDHTSLANWPPESTGSVYRAINASTDADSGTLANPIPYPEGVTSVSVAEGLYYSYQGKVYLCKLTMEACNWPPGTVGVWQWEEVA